MLKDKLKDIKEAIDAKKSEVASHAEAFEAKKSELEKADNVDITNPEDPFVVAADEAMKPLSKSRDELAVLEGQFERVALMVHDGGGDAPGKAAQRESEHDRDEDLRKGLKIDLGRKATTSDAYKALKDAGVFENGSQRRIDEQLTDPMDEGQFKSLITGGSTAAGGAFNVAQRFPGVVDLPQLPLGILDLVTVGQTGERSVEFVRILARTIRAAEVAEATSSGVIDGTTITATAGGLKPESDLTFDVLQAAVKTIAHWIPATRNQLADEPFLSTLINAELIDGVRRRAEQQVATGNGTGENIRGISNTSGIGAYTQGTTDATENAADAIHRAMTLVALSGFETSAVGLDPRDWEKIRLSKDANENYIWGPPSQAGVMQIWGKPVVSTIAIPQGTPIVGEWARALFLVREAVKVLMSDSHADFFIRNLVAILAEMRGTLVIPRPQAFAKVTLT